MNDARLIHRFLVFVFVAMMCVSSVEAQGRNVNDPDRNTGRDSGRGEDQGRDGGVTPPPRRGSSTGTSGRTTGTVVVVPQTRRVPRQNPTPRVRIIPGERVVAMTDTVRNSSIHTAYAPGPGVVLPDGAPEFIALAPLDQAEAAAAALTDAGALILRERDFPNLDRRAVFVDLRTVPFEDGLQSLAGAAPDAVLDFHNYYRYAQAAPRVYAASLVDQPDAPGCALPSEIRIGQIDGPVVMDHPALDGVALTARSVLDDTDAPVTVDHGTAVAALIVGEDDAGVLNGFASGAQLFAASAFAREGLTEAAQVERIGMALDWLAGEGAQLINMSFAGPVNAALDDLLTATSEQGAILVAAAGNAARDHDVHPAASGAVISVTAVDAALRRYPSANTGAHIEFAAPGVDLYVADRNGGAYASGTSYSAPIVTALAAQLVARGATSTDTVREQLRDQTRDLGDPGRDPHFGWGLAKSPGC